MLDDDGKKALAEVGSVVEYTATIVKKTGAENYEFHDTMSAGLQYNGDLTFPPGATLALLNAEMTSAASTSLLTVSGTLTGTPTLVDESASTTHRLVWSGNTLRYRKVGGFIMTVR